MRRVTQKFRTGETRSVFAMISLHPLQRQGKRSAELRALAVITLKEMWRWREDNTFLRTCKIRKRMQYVTPVRWPVHFPPDGNEILRSIVSLYPPAFHLLFRFLLVANVSRDEETCDISSVVNYLHFLHIFSFCARANFSVW